MFVRLYPKDIKTVNMDTDKIYKTIFFFILMSLVSKVYALDLKALNDSIANFKDYYNRQNKKYKTLKQKVHFRDTI